MIDFTRLLWNIRKPKKPLTDFQSAGWKWFRNEKVNYLHLANVTDEEAMRICPKLHVNFDWLWLISIDLSENNKKSKMPKNNRNVFKTLSNIQDGAFCENIFEYLAVNYFRWKLYLIRLTSLWIRLWIR